MSQYVEFVDPKNNISLAKAQLEEGFMTGGMFNNQVQSNHVPFSWSVHAINQVEKINIFVLSEEKFMDYRTQLLKQMVNMNPSIIKSSLRAYVEPEEYITLFAESIFGAPLKLTARADSPTLYNINLKDAYQQLNNLASTIAGNEAASGYPCSIKNLTCKSYLFKYEGQKDNEEYTILAAADFEGFEMAYPNQLNNVFGSFFGISNSVQNKENSDVLGHGGGEIVEWGSKFRYLLITPKQKDAEAARIFLKFINTFEMDERLKAQFNNGIVQRMQQEMALTANAQAQTQINIANNQFQQQKLNNMLRQNSQSISDGLMDSWNKRMDSQSRTSNNFSEAIRGVNTYTTTDGKNVEVSVSADHVYQNQYGDVYGVSGNEIDDDILNKINWTKISK